MNWLTIGKDDVLSQEWVALDLAIEQYGRDRMVGRGVAIQDVLIAIDCLQRSGLSIQPRLSDLTIEDFKKQLANMDMP